MNSETFEVELKFQVENFDAIERLLGTRDVTLLNESTQRDQYYRHPCRDFAETDEALRIRRSGIQAVVTEAVVTEAVVTEAVVTEAVDTEAVVTYKGPKLDAETKTRREIELPLHGDDQQWNQLLTSLGFTLSAEVVKRRREFSLVNEGRTFHIALDEVADVGLFVELETIASAVELDEARANIHRLGVSLELSNPTRASYLGMLLQNRQS